MHSMVQKGGVLSGRRKQLHISDREKKEGLEHGM